ncbi:MAG: tetratricopeptide repeat protein [Betaproteobacteria bacterium]
MALLLTAANTFANPSLRDTLPSARAGNSGAQYIAGMMYLFGDGTRQDIPEAVRWLKASAASGLPQAMVAMAALYDVGQGVSLDPDQATQWLQRAARAGDPTARGQLADDQKLAGQRDFRRASVLSDLKRPEAAIPYALKAANAGSANAQLLLGRAYHFGSGVPADQGAAFRWLQKSAANGLADGERHLAWMYEFGQGVPRDRAKALYYYDRAAAKGNKIARQAAANLRSWEYDHPPQYYGGSSAPGAAAPDNRCADNGGRMEGTQCLSNANRQAIDPSNGLHYN